VILAGDFAYKLKKPVDFGFLDFSTLAARRHFCDEEIRLNRRLAPSVYLDVVAITGTPDAPRIGGVGEAIEYAVRMKRFRREDEFDRLAERDALRIEHVDALAAQVAAFHERAAIAPPDGRYGRPEAALAPCLANFEHFETLALHGQQKARLESLRQWTLAEHARITPAIEARLRAGRVRECHGDLHLANIVLLDGEPLVFDALEFNPALRWTDVMSEVAFTVMDLEYRGHHDFAQRYLDDYLAASGDYGGLAVLPFYLVYRSLVRAKVAALRAQQPEGPGGERHARLDAFEIETHLSLAERFATPHRRCLLLMHGVSGSGKSHVARWLLQTGAWIRVRSDVERKRLAGLGSLQSSRAAPDEELYSAQATERTYARLRELAATVLEAGFPIIVDAAFLRADQRAPFAALASEAAVAWIVVALGAPRVTLRERVERRLATGRDPSEATVEVLEMQLDAVQPPAGPEAAHAIVFENDDGAQLLTLAQEIDRRCREAR